MIFRNISSKTFICVYVLIVVLVLSAAVVLVHSVFEKNLKTEIFIFSENLQRRVRETASGEYKRYLFLIESGKKAADYETENELRENLENIYNTSGPDGLVSDFISGTGYYYKNSPEKSSVFDPLTCLWKEDKKIRNKKITGKRWEIYTSDDNQNSGLILSIDVSVNLVVFYKLNRSDFINSYVKPAVNEEISGLDLSWVNTEPYSGLPLENERFKIDDYRFRPVNILTGISSDSGSLILPVPGIFSIKKYFDYSLNPLSERSENRVPEDISRGGRRPPESIDSIYFLIIKHPEGPFYYDIEYKSAVRFSETVFLFFLIGLLFMLMLYQLQKIVNLRKKEKAFVASVTHELRTPLTVIKSAADNLSSGIVSAEKLKIYSDLIMDNSGRLGKMIEEILIFSKFEEKRRNPPEYVLLDFENIFRKLEITLDAIASSEGISIFLDTAGLPESGYGNPDAIILIIENLVSNAVFHGYVNKKGEVRIKCRTLIPDKIRITVEDDGRGINPGELKHIFDPFFRDEISRQRQERGSGLGLFISRQKAENSGGKLSVESPYRRINGIKQSGCRFTLTLPFAYEKNSLKESEDG